MPPSSIHWIQLLTIWQELPAYGERPAVWRFSLEDPHSGRRHGFHSLDDLMAFLQRQMEEQTEERRAQARDAKPGNEEDSI